jgi:O-antigen/teichoic acid export membrane protein
MSALLRRSADLIRNSAFNFGSQAITVVAALICVPIIFRQLGTERFGLLTIVWGMLSYGIVFDLGTGPAAARAAASSLVQDGGRRIAAIFKAALTIQIGLGATAGLGIALLAPALLDLLNVPNVFRAEARDALYVLALTLPLVLIAQSQQAMLEAVERFDLIAYVRTPVAILNYAIPALGALADWSLAHIMLAILLTRVVAMFALHAFYRVAVPPSQGGSVRSELPALFRYGRWLAISGVLTQLLIYFDRFLLSGMHGLTAVAQYAAPYDAASKLLIVPGSIVLAMFPGLSKDAARNRLQDAIGRWQASARIIMIILVPVCALLILFAQPILHLWLGPQIGAEGIAAFRILLLATLFHAAAHPPVILIEAVGRPDVVARYYMVELIVYLPVVVFAVSRFGVVGAAWAWVLRTAGFMLWSIWYARRWLQRPQNTPSPEYANAHG